MGASPTSRPPATTSTGWWRRSGQTRPAASRVVAMAQAPIITFLSDYGLDDDFVGICHGVVAGLCPADRSLDVTHGSPRPDVQARAIVLGEALAYLPIGVRLAVVDPDVGAQRRAI